MDQEQSRRDRNMDAKRARIFQAARRAFEERGYARVTTRSVSDEADVAAGTLFRYAITKADLLMMVYNVELAEAIAAGRSAARGIEDPAEAVFALVAPVLHRNADQSQNAIHYQRELLFGHGPMLHRDEGLALVETLEAAIADILIGTVEHVEPSTADEAQRASRLIFAALHLALAQPSTGRHLEVSGAEELRGHIALVVRGFLDTIDLTHHHGDAGRPASATTTQQGEPR